MPIVIDVDFQLRWAVPVHVQMRGYTRNRIDGPDAALSALRCQWPSKDGPEFRLAILRCLRALTQHGSAELARESFIEAAVAAKVLA
ncbi:DUF982 domain-containing protein [Rhizobium sp. S163]|uniref:DUF982 domain-containing protein n=1 Tax=Rhizobium sp. S163 TaxID=3055039 RepID=UPI0025A9949D|nr:DUF982 domain-containing protein [Rhizobium sp. S163]MDM9646428.1 DUF982 domain-containing protein [Rhizobium sp. S163]